MGMNKTYPQKRKERDEGFRFASGVLAARHADLYEGGLALLHRLAAAPESGPPLLELLRREHLVADQLEAAAAAPLPPEVRGPAWSCADTSGVDSCCHTYVIMSFV